MSMNTYYRIKKEGTVYLLPFLTTGFCVSNDGIDVLGLDDELLHLKSEDIEGVGIETVAILQDLRHEYRRLTKDGVGSN